MRERGGKRRRGKGEEGEGRGEGTGGRQFVLCPRKKRKKSRRLWAGMLILGLKAVFLSLAQSLSGNIHALT